MLKLLKPILFSLLLLTAGAGCGAYTKISSSKNPSYGGKVFKKIAVEARNSRGQEVLAVEWTFKRKMDNPDLEVTPYSDLFRPDQTYTSAQINETFRSRGIEGLLTVRMEQEVQESVYHPPTSSTTEVKNKKDGKTITTSTSGGYTENRLIQKHFLSFIEPSEWKTVWTSTAVTKGDPSWADSQDFYNALVNASMKSLRKDGLVVIPEK